MILKPYSNHIEDYLVHDTIIDFKNELITQLADKLFSQSNNEIEYIQFAYEYVRDHIAHSADINNDLLIYRASEVLKEGHGICFAKSHLLTALLRCRAIPTGFCYQKLILDDETNPVLIYHGLNGIFIKKLNKWIRLDARGNKNGINAQFSLEDEQLAFKVRPNLGEKDLLIVYPKPDEAVIKKLSLYKTRTELWNDLPNQLSFT